MAGTKFSLPPEVRRFSGLYRFIPPESYRDLGIDPEDVPLGTIPAEDHPPFLPGRYGGNAYGLGFFEHTGLSDSEARLLENLDVSGSGQEEANHRKLNDIFKRLGLLIRYSSQGKPFYLIPRQFVAHFLVEVQAQADEIIAFLKDLLSRRLRETLRVGLVSADSELLMPELQRRMPHLEFNEIRDLEALKVKRRRLEALVMLGDPQGFILNELAVRGQEQPGDAEELEALGHFAASRLYELLEEDGELLCLAEHPLASGREAVKVTFKSAEDQKRFVLFSHVYRTRRRYLAEAGPAVEAERSDFEAFLSGLGLYHETMEGFLGGRHPDQLSAGEIDSLPYEDLPLPQGSAARVMSDWRRWLGAYFTVERLDPVLPEAQEKAWREHYEVAGSLPPTLIVCRGVRKRPPVTLGRLENQASWRDMAGCRRELLAGYKDSFQYVVRVLDYLEQVRRGTLDTLPGLELTRLKKPFESAVRHPQLEYTLRLMEMRSRLQQLEQWLNPRGLMGARTPVLANLDKLALLGLVEGCLDQLYLIVLGHSTMTRVTFGKLPETSLWPLTDLNRYRDLEEAVTVIRLYRLLSVAEAAAAAPGGRLAQHQVEEMFSLYDGSIRVVTNIDLTWKDLVDDQILRVGGVQAKATRKMLKLFDLFQHLNDWQELETAGPRLKEAMADFDPDRLADVHEVIALLDQVRRFVGAFYPADSSARPYFFRALLSCEMHGTGRLLSRLGTEAGFALLWVCVHTAERRLLNFNQLVEGNGDGDVAVRLEKLRWALMTMDPRDLSPRWLAKLRKEITAGREAYIRDSGLYLTLDRETGALTPCFLEADSELDRLEEELAQAESKSLADISPQRLRSLDLLVDDLSRFLAAQEGRGELANRMTPRFEALVRRLEHYLITQLLTLPDFAGNLRRTFKYCPRLSEKLLPRPAQHPGGIRRLDSAQKFSAIYHGRVEQFQDMDLSHELARQEFGPAAAGVVGLSRTQFQTLTASLRQVLDKKPSLARLLPLVVLLFRESDGVRGDAQVQASPLTRRISLAGEEEEELDFLLRHWQVIGRVVDGSCCLASLEPLLARQDPIMVEALFLMAVVTTAARKEGALTEDLLDRFFELLNRIRDLSLRGKTASQAYHEHIEMFARRNLAFEYYKDIQSGEAPTASLRHLLETTRLPGGVGEREDCVSRGRMMAGLDRLLKLRDLPLLSSLDIQMLNHEVPVPYIYRLKGLHSMGVTHFERDLYEGKRIYRGLAALPGEVQDLLLKGLADPERPVCLVGYSRTASLLTYNNQIRLLLVGLAAARQLDSGQGGVTTVSFLPLSQVIERKFELVNEMISALDPEALLKKNGLARLVRAKEGLVLEMDPATSLVTLNFHDPATLGRKIEAVRRASTPTKLKRLYHSELKRLNLTAYRSLDYQERLEAAFRENLRRLGGQMIEKVRDRMAVEEDPSKLEEMFNAAWEEGLELPLSPDRQQSLRDLFEMNLERVRSRLLDDINRKLASTDSAPALDALWKKTRRGLQAESVYLGKDVVLRVAEQFDRRARELTRDNRPVL